jgi:hypothetical protein
MALGVNYEQGAGGEDFLPVVKYNAKAGRWLRVDRSDDGKTYDDVDITKTFKAVFDFEYVQTGHISFASGKAPDFAVATIGERVPGPPTENHKPGIRILVKLGKDCGGDVRELASVAKAFIRGMDQLHDDYLAGVKANPGKLPVVVMSDTTAIVSEGKQQKSTNYVPVFEIVSWVPRPVDLVNSPRAASTVAAAPAASSGGSPPSTGSTRAAPPANKVEDEDEFG